MPEAPNLLEQFSSSLIREDVGIIDFVESPKYLGRKLYPRQRTLLKIIFLEDLDDYDKAVIAEWSDPDGECTIVPKLEERIEYLKNNGFPHFATVQLVGGRRSSKGFITACCLAYKVFRLTQLDDLHEHFHIPSGKEIEFSIVAASLDQAVARQFADAFDAIVDVKPLQKQKLIGRSLAQSLTINTPSDVRRIAQLRASGMKVDRDMASLIVQAHGTNSKTIRGAASMMFIFDEMAHLIGGESRMSDEELFKAALPSLRQFQKDAQIFANSSPYTKTGKFFELYNQSLELDPPETGAPVYPDHLMFQFPSWELYKDWDKFPGTAPPQVFDPKDDPQLAREEQADPDSFRVEYRAQFAEVIDAFLDPKMVDRMFDPNYSMQVVGRELKPQAGAIGFVRYKGHGDPASVNANFGVAVGHVEEITTDSGIVEQHVVFDLIDAFYPEDFIDPEDPDQRPVIDWLQVVPTITEMINNFRPFEFTFDQFDSTMAIQQLQENLSKLGVGETVVYSKFATPAVNERRWNNFKSALYLGRVHAPHPTTYGSSGKNSIELARDELKYLQIKNKRVDKQSIGPVQTKDIADCIAEVTDALIGDVINVGNVGAAPVFGSQGGYYIGKGSGGNTHLFPEMASWYGDRPGMPIFIPGRGQRRPR